MVVDHQVAQIICFHSGFHVGTPPFGWRGDLVHELCNQSCSQLARQVLYRKSCRCFACLAHNPAERVLCVTCARLLCGLCDTSTNISTSTILCRNNSSSHCARSSFDHFQVFSSFDVSVAALVVTAAFSSKTTAIFMNFYKSPMNLAFGWGSTLYPLKVSSKLYSRESCAVTALSCPDLAQVVRGIF
jgi:hypothetical protein